MIENQKNIYSHLSALDGFRGFLAVWVFLGHLSGAVGFKFPVLSAPGYAVDLFMVLSGFLMMHKWKIKISTDGLFSRTTLDFYISRFFRIAPLFYFLLIICFFSLNSLSEMTNFNSKQIPPPWIVDLENYHPNKSWDFSSINWVALHTTFLFGLVPGMENSSPLPEWSLSLEMQFYFIFPLLLVAIKRNLLLVLAVISACLCLASPKIFGMYLEPGTIAHFGQPSLLVYRLNAFIAGMILADLYKTTNNKSFHKIYLLLGLIICVSVLSSLTILGCILFALICRSRVPIFTDIFCSKPMKFLGEISYSLYLVHMLLIIPSVYFLIKYVNIVHFSPLLRFVLGIGVIFPIVIAFSYILYKLIEVPTIALGKFKTKIFMHKIQFK